MRLFHFTSLKHYRRISRDPGGICKGMIPVLELGKVVPKPGVQWLTSDPEWVQDWDIDRSKPYRKTDVRLAVTIHPLFIENLVPWPDYARHVHPELRAYLAQFPSSRFWAVYIGHIPREWICDKQRNPVPYEPISHQS